MSLKRNFDTVLINVMDGKAFPFGQKLKIHPSGRGYEVDPASGDPIVTEPGTDMTLKNACMEAIGAVVANSNGISGTEIMEFFEIANMIKAGGVVEFKDEKPITQLKDRISKVYGNNLLLAGAAIKVLTTDFVEEAAA